MKREGMRKAYAANPEKFNAANRARYAADPEKFKKAVERYRREVLGQRPRPPKESREVYLAKKRARARLETYGITDSDLARMVAAQSNKCAVCEDHFTDSRKRHVDHCHSTGVVRGLLCSLCNVGIGHFRDKPELLLKAVAYLKR